MTGVVPTGNTYDKYGSTNPVERRLMRGFFDVLGGVLPNRDPTTVLDVGIGEGEVAVHVRERYPGALVVGVDLPDPTLAAHWTVRGLRGVYGNIARLPFPSASFDLVMAVEVLEHVPDPTAALAELDRVCRGDLVVSVPARARVAGRQHGAGQVPRRHGQHAGSHPALVGPAVLPSRGHAVRRRQRPHAVPVDRGRCPFARRCRRVRDESARDDDPRPHRRARPRVQRRRTGIGRRPPLLAAGPRRRGPRPCAAHRHQHDRRCSGHRRDRLPPVGHVARGGRRVRPGGAPRAALPTVRPAPAGAGR